MRRKLVAGNWKMNHTRPETRQFIEALLEEVSSETQADILLAPSFTCLETASRAMEGRPIRLAAQNLYPAESGAFTGEISPTMLKDAGCDSVILGHSERRQHFGETDALINHKIRFALENDLAVIFCIGETGAQREQGSTEEVLSRQLLSGLEGVSEDDWKLITIAYEPVWAIGTGKNASPEEADRAHQYIREQLKKWVNATCAEKTRILYGGSVSGKNSGELMAQSDIDGVLVGSASLDPTSFCDIIASVK